MYAIHVSHSIVINICFHLVYFLKHGAKEFRVVRLNLEVTNNVRQEVKQFVLEDAFGRDIGDIVPNQFHTHDVLARGLGVQLANLSVDGMRDGVGAVVGLFVEYCEDLLRDVEGVFDQLLEYDFVVSLAELVGHFDVLVEHLLIVV